MKMMNALVFVFLYFILASANSGCKREDTQKMSYSADQFVMGADLSYVNQVLDHGGIYRKNDKEVNPYQLFSDEGCNLVRLRLWNDPAWTRKVYDDSSVCLYSGYQDVKEAIRESENAGMQVCLDFHYSDVWADPHHQSIPNSWRGLGIEELKDSLFSFTKNTLESLWREELLPEYVQIGNEINPGLLDPVGYHEKSGWTNTVDLINAGLDATRAVEEMAGEKIQTIIHIAQPENVEAWFDNALAQGLADFDILGLSYYCKWSSVPLDSLSDYIRRFKVKYNKEIMVVETAYPWTLERADDYPNIFSKGTDSYPLSPEGQLEYLIDLTQAIINGGGTGIMYWEPAWISCNMKDLWNEGSGWENNTFFDFRDNNNLLPGIEYMRYRYNFEH